MLVSLNLSPTDNELIFQALALMFYGFFTNMALSRGYKVKRARIVIWNAFFLFFGGYSLATTGWFDLSIIVFLSSFLAILLTWFDKRDKK